MFSQAPAVVAMAMPLAKRREDEVSVGSTPLAKQPSNQASDYASSPVKTKTVTGRISNMNCYINNGTRTVYYKSLRLGKTIKCELIALSQKLY